MRYIPLLVIAAALLVAAAAHGGSPGKPTSVTLTQTTPNPHYGDTLAFSVDGDTGYVHTVCIQSGTTYDYGLRQLVVGYPQYAAQAPLTWANPTGALISCTSTYQPIVRISKTPLWNTRCQQYPQPSFCYVLGKVAATISYTATG